MSLKKMTKRMKDTFLIGLLLENEEVFYCDFNTFREDDFVIKGTPEGEILSSGYVAYLELSEAWHKVLNKEIEPIYIHEELANHLEQCRDFNLFLETDKYIFYCAEQESDWNSTTLMFDKKGKLISDNYFGYEAFMEAYEEGGNEDE